MGMNIYRILESHTIIEWLSRMNVKDEYVKPRVINPGGWETGRPGVQGWETGTTVSQYSSFLEESPPDSTMLHVREVCDSSSVYGDSVMHEVVCTEICGVSQTKNQSGKRPLRGKKFRGKSWKRLSVRTTCVRLESKSSSCSLEGSRAACRHEEGPCRVPNYHMIHHSLPNGTLCPVTTMSYDWLDYELLLVMLCDYQGHCPLWIIVERP